MDVLAIQSCSAHVHDCMYVGSGRSTPIKTQEEGKERGLEATPPISCSQQFQHRKISIDTIQQKKNIGINHFNRQAN